MAKPAHVSLRPRLGAILPLLLLTALVVLQVRQGFVRIGVLRDRQRSQFLNAVERMNFEVASAVEGDIARGLEQVTTLAEILGLMDLDGPSRREALQRFRESNSGCLAASLREESDAPGPVEWLQDARALLFRAPLQGAKQASSKALKQAFRGPSEVALTLMADPFFERVARFQPIEGVGNVLLSPVGRVVALDSAAQPLDLEIGQDLGSRFDREVLAQVLLQKERVRAGGARLFVSPLQSPRASESLDERPLFLLVSVVPDAALVVKARPAEHEARLVVLGGLLSTSGLLVVAYLFHRASLRERSLRQFNRGLERKKILAERLATSERLSALGLLTAGVAHEINNPLEGIRNYLSLLRSQDLSPEQREQYIQRVEFGLERIRVIVRDLLGFARPNTSSGLFDLRNAVQKGLDLARLASDLKGIEVKLEGCMLESAGEQRDLLVRGDAGGLGQVVLNLILNAGRAADRRVVVSLRAEPEELILSVEDDGQGIAPEDLPHVFDPFFTRAQKDLADAPEGDADKEGENCGSGGTGLGLSISYSIVQTHSGKLSASNLPGGGARFEVRLDRADLNANNEETITDPEGLA